MGETINCTITTEQMTHKAETTVESKMSWIWVNSSLLNKTAQTFPGILANMLYGRTVEKSFQFTYTGKAAPGTMCPFLKNSGLYS